MTVEEAINGVDKLNINYAYDEIQKTKWLNILDRRIAAEVTDSIEPEYSYPIDRDKELIIPDKYAECYILWLLAKMAFYNDEDIAYNNYTQAFNSLYDEYRAWYIRHNRPLQANAVRY